MLYHLVYKYHFLLGIQPPYQLDNLDINKKVEMGKETVIEITCQ